MTGPLDDAELGRLAERDYQVWVRSFVDTPDVEILGGSELLIRRSELEHIYLSAVFGARLTPDVADARIHEVVADLGRDGRAFIWSVWPSDTPADLVDRLVAAGFGDDGTGPLMACSLADASGLDEPAPAGLEVREATSPGAIAEIGAFALAEMEEEPGSARFQATLERLATEANPRLRLFGGWSEGRLVASSGLHTGSGVAGIYAVATSESYRGRGFGRALTAAAMAAGRHAGLSTTVLLASELGQPVYRRLGYREVGDVRFLVWPGSSAG